MLKIINIYLDSRIVLLSSVTVKSELLQQCITVPKIPQFNGVWTPGHSGVKSNEKTHVWHSIFTQQT